MYKYNDGLYVWASEIDPNALLQAGKTSRLPIIAGPVALMADAHVGIGATVGSVIATEHAIIPAAVGVDIGCGMIATETSLTAGDLPDLCRLMPLVEKRIPAGVGQGHENGYAFGKMYGKVADALGDLHTQVSQKQAHTIVAQFGTLGSGNHFVEVCLDERNRVWTVLHSGSRGIGNQLAQYHIKAAKTLARQLEIRLEDPDLAYFMDDQPEFQAYIDDMLWAQNYAYHSRAEMNRQLLKSLFEVVGYGRSIRVINCHHNYTERERHDDRLLWVTRKGAIRMADGDWGVIPGSMGTGTYVVSGLANRLSYNSASHGAGRRLSRSQARRELSPESLTEWMGDRTWNTSHASSLVDEHPLAYKDIGQVMEDQRDLCRIEHKLTQLFNFKG
jgi:tRNA-splicing ligase RtcB (3'-phosphate/5'-hydroxy nucleic acid ligase)